MKYASIGSTSILAMVLLTACSSNSDSESGPAAVSDAGDPSADSSTNEEPGNNDSPPSEPDGEAPDNVQTPNDQTGEPDVSATDGNNPFADENPDAATVVARLGYPTVRNQVDDIVSMSFLSLYFDIRPAIYTALRQSSPWDGSNNTKACPGGGSGTGTVTGPNHFDFVLDHCVIDGHVLTGRLAIDVDPAVFGMGNRLIEATSFDDLRIEADDGRTLVVSGQSTREDEDIGNIECESVAALHSRTSRNYIESARYESTHETITLTDATWWQTQATGTRVGGEGCSSPTQLSFEGSGTVVSTGFAMNTPATFEKRGDILRDETGDMSAAEAHLAADFGDGSTLTVTLTSDVDSEVLVDLIADDVAASFYDTYRFEAHTAIPAINDPQP